MVTSTPRKLTLDDIADLRAYEQEREAFRAHVIALKKRRRVPVGPIITLLFENRDTIRFQIQEMARVERLESDDAIQGELDTYNPLIPEPGQLSATLFIELGGSGDRDADDLQLREWLPKLVGIERAVDLVAGEGAGAVRVSCVPDAEHEKQLTREEVTSSVHYVHWDLTAEQVEAVARGPVRLEVTHHQYPHAADLGEATVAELLADLRP